MKIQSPRMNKVIFLTCLALGLLIIGPVAAMAQFASMGNLFGLGPSILGVGSSASDGCAPNRVPGVCGSGYTFWSVNGINFNELNFSHHLPIRLDDRTFFMGYARADFNDFPKSADGVDGSLRFGGHLSRDFGSCMLAVAHGGYDANRWLGSWRSGGRVGFNTAYRMGADTAGAGAIYYFRSLGDSIFFRGDRNGYEVIASYAHTLFYGGPMLGISWRGYEFDADQTTPGDQKMRGWNASADFSMPGSIIKITGRVGHDTVNLDYYSIGASLNLAF